MNIAKRFLTSLTFILALLTSPWFCAQGAEDAQTPALATDPQNKWSETNGDGLYEALCTDGVVIRMRRYRPTPDAQFRSGNQPVLLFPGIMENINQFLPSSSAAPECAKRYRGMKLRTPLAHWAQNDPYIVEDPMLYFSLGQYLWNQGYDPWFANYRGIGRGAYKSECIKGDKVTLDTWATLDTPAAINKVIEVTGFKPVIGGHSTGGLVSYAFLQGAYVDPEELKEARSGGYNPHVKSDPELSRQRHGLVRGVIALDPACIPPMPGWVNNRRFWRMASKPSYYKLSGMAANLDIILTRGAVNHVVACLFDGFYDRSTNSQDYTGTNEALNIWNTHDKHPNMNDWIAFHVLENSYSQALGQYLDFGINQTAREHWQNGKENIDLKKGPAPVEDDGYYNYLAHMDLVSAPFITLLSHYDGLVKADEVIKDLMQAKVKHLDDHWFVLPNTGHMNVHEGYTASMVGYPMIGDWLRKVCGGPQSAVAVDLDLNSAMPR